MSFFDVKKDDRVVAIRDGRKGVCTNTLGMLVYVKWDDGKEDTINAFRIEPEKKGKR